MARIYLANFGDRNVVDYGGALLVWDSEDGSYSVDVLERDEQEVWHIWTISLDRIADFSAAWFGADADLVAVSRCCDHDSLRADLTGANGIYALCQAYLSLARYHGHDNFDVYPLRLDYAELMARYRDLPYLGFEALDCAGFMPPQIEYADDWLTIDTDNGSFVLPGDLASESMRRAAAYDTDPSDNWNDTVSEIYRAASLADVRQYCPESVESVESVEIAQGYFCRFSAPGYLDCTEWSGPFETLREAYEDLVSLQ